MPDEGRADAARATVVLLRGLSDQAAHEIEYQSLALCAWPYLHALEALARAVAAQHPEGTRPPDGRLDAALVGVYRYPDWQDPGARRKPDDLPRPGGPEAADPPGPDADQPADLRGGGAAARS
jgi:hypothetical protein